MTDQILKLNYQLTVLKEEKKELERKINQLQEQVDFLLKQEYNLNSEVNYEGLK